MSPDYWVWKMRDLCAEHPLRRQVAKERPRPYSLMARMEDNCLNHFALMYGMAQLPEGGCNARLH